MKIIRIIGHPYLMIGLFLIILISGRSIGGVYMLYLILALPHFGIHAVLAICGILLTVFSYRSLKIAQKSVIQKLMGANGVVCLMLSIFMFFYNDHQLYNFGSFNSVAFWITFGFFVTSAICYLIILALKMPVSGSCNTQIPQS